MGLISGLKLACRSMVRHGMRTFLMMLGVMVGIASLTILYSVGESTQQVTVNRFKKMVGTFDTVFIRPGGGPMRGMASLANVDPTLRFEDAKAIASEVPGVRRVSLMQSAFDIDVKYRDRTFSTFITGASANWIDIRGEEVALGSMITDEDVQQLGRVAVIGADIKKELFPDEEAIGKTLRIGEVPFQVKGIMASRGAGPGGGSMDNFILIPVTTASRRLFNRDYLTSVAAQLTDSDQSAAVIQRITALLRERHHLAATALNDFTITDPRAMANQVAQVSSTLSKTLTGVAIIAMLIGGVVIMSLMLIAVSERRKEIGVRRSVGASRQDILLQFLLEAMLVSCLGGIVGIAVGLGGTNIVDRMQQLPVLLARDVLRLAAGLSVGVGLLFGLYPAWKAARVDPVAALRS